MTIIPNTYMSIHSIDCIFASLGPSIGSPVVLNLGSERGGTQITLFISAGDEEYSKRLVDAINGVPLRVETPDIDHAAAHNAAANYFKDGILR